MNQYFDMMIKEHLQDILCEAEKEYTLASIYKIRNVIRKRVKVNQPPQEGTVDNQLQDCAVSPSFSQSRL